MNMNSSKVNEILDRMDREIDNMWKAFDEIDKVLEKVNADKPEPDREPEYDPEYELDEEA